MARQPSIPPHFVRLCRDWAGNINSMTRAIDSTGGLTMGTHRPYDNDLGRHLTNEEWIVHLWEKLEQEIRDLVTYATGPRAGELDDPRDADRLKRFHTFIVKTLDELRVEFGVPA